MSLLYAIPGPLDENSLDLSITAGDTHTCTNAGHVQKHFLEHPSSNLTGDLYYMAL
jgi:hypothetical protein